MSGHTTRIALICSCFFLGAPSLWAQRTQLKAPWNMYSPQTDVQLGKQNAEFSKQNADLQKQKEELVKQAAKLKTVLAAETARAKNLQQQLEQLRVQQQRKRLANQNSEPLP